MTGIVVLLLVLLYECHRLLDSADRMRKSEELTPEFSVSTLAFIFYGFVCINHPIYESQDPNGVSAQTMLL